MGLTYINLEVANVAKPAKHKRVRCLVDSGAMYTVLPSNVLKRLGVKPRSTEEFGLANGDVIKRKVGGALFFYRKREGVSPVIFGEPGDSNLLGVMTLEALGLMLDPLRRTLKPLPLLLASHRKRFHA